MSSFTKGPRRTGAQRLPEAPYFFLTYFFLKEKVSKKNFNLASYMLLGSVRWHGDGGRVGTDGKGPCWSRPLGGCCGSARPWDMVRSGGLA